MARWQNLTVMAASSKFVYIYFYCEGTVASWNNPLLQPPSGATMPAPPMYTSPIFVNSPVRSIFTLPWNDTSLEAATCPEEAACDDGSSPGDCLQARLLEGRALSVVEGETLPETRVRVGYTAPNGSFVPLRNVTVLAVLHTASGIQRPLLYEPDVAAAKRWDGIDAIEQKKLVNAESAPSDENGVAVFSKLQLSLWGSGTDTTGKLTGNIRPFPASAHYIAFCTPGVTDGSAMDGCARSCAVHVRSRLARLTWITHPLVVRSSRVDPLVVEPGEKLLGDRAKLAALPPTPTIRATDEEGNGVPDIAADPFLYDLEHARQVCALPQFGVTVSDFDLENDPPNARECTLLAFLDTMDQVKLKRRTSETDRFATGEQGFLGLGVVFVSIQAREANDYAAKGLNGRLRVVMLSADWEVREPPEAPATHRTCGVQADGRWPVAAVLPLAS